MRLPVGRSLMKAHGVRKSGLEQIVVANSDAAKNVAEEIAFFPVELFEGCDVALAQYERLERPHRPERNDDCESIVLADDALVSLEFQSKIIAQKTGMLFSVIGTERLIFASR